MDKNIVKFTETDPIKTYSRPSLMQQLFDSITKAKNEQAGVYDLKQNETLLKNQTKVKEAAAEAEAARLIVLIAESKMKQIGLSMERMTCDFSELYKMAEMNLAMQLKNIDEMPIDEGRKERMRRNAEARADRTIEKHIRNYEEADEVVKSGLWTGRIN